MHLEPRFKVIIAIIIGALLFGAGMKMNTWLKPATEEIQVLSAGEALPAENQQPQSPNVPAPATNPDAIKPQEIKVHVAGAVRKPGVYQLLSGDRVNDAVQLAEPLTKADLNTLPLARVIMDGETIYVPEIGEKISDNPPRSALITPKTTPATSNALAGSAGGSGGKVNLNTAESAQLDQALPGIGPALAQRIVDYRTQNGPFKSPADIKKVSGIGDKKYEQLKDLITAP